jgi:3-oxoacyl-[acyl-carrier protein] reductase
MTSWRAKDESAARPYRSGSAAYNNPNRARVPRAIVAFLLDESRCRIVEFIQVIISQYEIHGNAFVTELLQARADLLHGTRVLMRERVLITGGASGIGLATARRCEAEGYEVVVIDRAPGGMQADLSDPDQTADALARVLHDGPITRLVNNVATVRPGPVEEQRRNDLEVAVSLNVRCTIQCLQALLPGMKEAGFGRVVNISSRAALGKELRTVYAATKAAVIGMTKVWALELGKYGITANAIGPGPIRTALFDQVNPADSPSTQAIIDAIPMRRIGTTDDVAHSIAFMLDARSSFVTGQVLYVCGGLTVGAAGV